MFWEKWTSELTQLQNRNNRRLEQCSWEDASLIRKIRGELAVPQISEFELEVVIQDLIDMAQDARGRKESLKEALGVSPEEFCQGVYANCRHTGWAERILGFFMRLIAPGFTIFVVSGLFWMSSYDYFLLREQLTGESMGLQGQTVMLLPVRLLVLLAVFFLILELWQLLIAPRLMRWRGGRWISIGFVLVAWVIFVFGIKTEGYWSEGRMVGFNLPYAIPLYFLLVLVLYLVWRWWIHRLSLEYDWKRAEDRTN